MQIVKFNDVNTVINQHQTGNWADGKHRTLKVLVLLEKVEKLVELWHEGMVYNLVCILSINQHLLVRNLEF